MPPQCKADPPGWRQDTNGQQPYWYDGGPNYNRAHVWVPAQTDGQPASNCLYCGADSGIRAVPYPAPASTENVVETTNTQPHTNTQPT